MMPLTVIKPAVAATLLVLAATLPGCAGQSPSSPAVTPSTVTAQSTYTLSGVVVAETAAGTVPLEGAQVWVRGQNATSDATGHYSLDGLPALTGSARATKAGYAVQTKDLTIGGDAQLDFQLVRSAIYSLSGVIAERSGAGQTPVEGVLVEVASMPCDPDGSGCAAFGFPIAVLQSATTNKNGFYTIGGLYQGPNNFIWVTKAGFEDPYPQRPGASEGGDALTIDGDTRFDLVIIRR